MLKIKDHMLWPLESPDLAQKTYERCWSDVLRLSTTIIKTLAEGKSSFFVPEPCQGTVNLFWWLMVVLLSNFILFY